MQIPSPLKDPSNYESLQSGTQRDTFGTNEKRTITLPNLTIGQDYRMAFSCEVANSLAGKGVAVRVAHGGLLANAFAECGEVSDEANQFKTVGGTMTFQARATTETVDFFWRRTGGAGVARIRRLSVVPETLVGA